MNNSDIANIQPPTLEAIDAERARRRLYVFVQQAWQYADPSKFIASWAIEAVCEHLEAVARGQIKRLLINIPPRHSKSLTAAVFFPAWAWITHPEISFLTASYSHDLSKRDSQRCRTVIRSPWYQQYYGDCFSIVDDQDEKTRFKNDKGGQRIATSVGGIGTGDGGDIIIVDDPHKADEVWSDTKRQSVLDWWDTTLSTRLNDPANGAYILIMQRLHVNDLAGHVLEKGGWEHLCLPARYEPERKCATSIGWTDPRTIDGSLLLPERFPEPEVARLEESLGSIGAAGQLQQRPVARGGNLVKEDWFRVYDEIPRSTISRIVQSVDSGLKDGPKNSRSVCVTGADTPHGVYILDVWADRVDFPGLESAIVACSDKWNPDEILIEDKASGIPLIQRLKRERKDFTTPIRAIEPVGDKFTRMMSVTPQIEAGFVFLPRSASWLQDFINEITAFPNHPLKDLADALSQLLRYLHNGNRSMADILAGVGVGERRAVEQEEDFNPGGGRNDTSHHGRGKPDVW